MQIKKKSFFRNIKYISVKIIKCSINFLKKIKNIYQALHTAIQYNMRLQKMVNFLCINLIILTFLNYTVMQISKIVLKIILRLKKSLIVSDCFQRIYRALQCKLAVFQTLYAIDFFNVCLENSQSQSIHLPNPQQQRWLHFYNKEKHIFTCYLMLNSVSEYFSFIYFLIMYEMLLLQLLRLILIYLPSNSLFNVKCLSDYNISIQIQQEPFSDSID